MLKKTLLLLLPVVILFCCSSSPLGDGSLKGRLPGGWEDVKPLNPETILRVIKYHVPIPYELTIKQAPADAAPSADTKWAFLEEKNIPGPTVPLGDEWKETERNVRVYRKKFEDGRILDSFVDVRLEKPTAERFLNSLTSSSPDSP